jgi:hypothetical protein
MLELLLLAWKRFRFALGLVAGMSLFVYFLSIRQVELRSLAREEAAARGVLDIEKTALLASANGSAHAGITADYEKKANDLFTQYEKKRSNLFTFCLKTPDVVEPSANLDLCLNIYFFFPYWPALLLVGYMLHRWLYAEKLGTSKGASLHAFAHEGHYITVDLAISLMLIFLAYRATSLFDLRAAIPRQYRPYHLAGLYLVLISGISSLGHEYSRIERELGNWPAGLCFHAWLIQQSKRLWSLVRPSRMWTRVGSAAVLLSLLLPYCACDENTKLRGYEFMALVSEWNWPGVVFPIIYVTSLSLLAVLLFRSRRWQLRIRKVCWLLLSASWGMWLGFAFQEVSGKSPLAQGSIYGEMLVDPTSRQAKETVDLLDPSSIPDWVVWSWWAGFVVFPAILFIARNQPLLRRAGAAFADTFKKKIAQALGALGGSLIAAVLVCCFAQLSMFRWGMAVLLLGGLVELVGLRHEILIGLAEPPLATAAHTLTSMPAQSSDAETVHAD